MRGGVAWGEGWGGGGGGDGGEGREGGVDTQGAESRQSGNRTSSRILSLTKSITISHNLHHTATNVQGGINCSF